MSWSASPSVDAADLEGVSRRGLGKYAGPPGPGPQPACPQPSSPAGTPTHGPPRCAGGQVEEGGLWCSGPMVIPTVVPAGLSWQGHAHSCPQLCRAGWGRGGGEEVGSEGCVSWKSKASSCLILSPGQMYTLPLSFCSWGG